MKKKRSIVTVLMLIFVIIIALILIRTLQFSNFSKNELGSGMVQKDSRSEEIMRVVVASDLHYLAQELTDHGEYFENMIRNSDGKLMEYSEELVDAFLYQMTEEKPDLVILTGDLSFNGEKISHESLAKKFSILTENGIQVYVIPGNHDLNYPYAASFHEDSFQLIDSMDAEEFRDCYRDFGYSQALSHDPYSLSYVIDLEGEFRLLFVDVNGNERAGAITEESLAWVEEILKDAERENKRVLAFSHQNLLKHNPLFTDGFVIGNASALQALYEQYGVLCNFSGHMHMQHIKSEAGLTEILTSALSITPMHYGIITIGNEGLRYELSSVDVEAWARMQGSENEELLNFSKYARNFFWNGSYTQVFEAVKGESDAAELAEFMANVNLYYFTGEMDLLQWDESLANRWKSIGGFWSVYISSIEEEVGQSHRYYDFGSMKE